VTGYRSRSELQAEAGSGGDDAVDRIPGWHGVETSTARWASAKWWSSHWTAKAGVLRGVLTARVHQRTLQRVRDVPVGGAVEVWWRKRRFACTESACGRGTFAEHTRQVPTRARCTTRMKVAVLEAVAWAGRAVLEVAASFGVAWWTVQAVINTAAKAMANPDARPVRHLGIDEHRYQRMWFFRDPDTAKWRRYEPWMTTMVDLDTGVVLGVVDGRGSAGVKAWLTARSLAWRGGVQVVAIDPVRRSARPSPTRCPTRRYWSITFIWSSSPTRCSPWSARESPATSKADGAAPSTPLGRTGGRRSVTWAPHGAMGREPEAPRRPGPLARAVVGCFRSGECPGDVQGDVVGCVSHLDVGE